MTDKKERVVLSCDDKKIYETIKAHEKELNDYCHQLYLESEYEDYVAEHKNEDCLSFDEWVKLNDEPKLD